VQEKKLEVVIEPGMKPGDTIVFPKECSDQHEYGEAGDVHIVFQVADEDSGFKRSGDDLLISVQIGLRQALLGCTEVVKGHPAHLEGLHVDIPAGVQNGETVVILEEGMPRRGAQGAKGRGSLRVLVNVQVTALEKAAIVKPEAVEALRGLFTL
jgi:molecular chaperone DnaJ